MVLRSGHAAFRDLGFLLDERGHVAPSEILQDRRGATQSINNDLTAQLPSLPWNLSARSRAVSFLGFSDSAFGHHAIETRGNHTTFLHVNDLLGKKKCLYYQNHGTVDDCSHCGNHSDQCNSEHCTMWEGVCRTTDVGNGFRIGEWAYYSGPSRPYGEDNATFGDRVQIMGPGKVTKEPKDMDQAEKERNDKHNTGEKTWKLVWFPGNMNNVKVQSLSDSPICSGEGDARKCPPEPPSDEARIARAEAIFHLKPHGKLIAGIGALAPCDKDGRIASTPDGTFCQDNQACVTALPADFSKYTGKFCWHWFNPECPEHKCPPTPYCPPPPKPKRGQKPQPYECPPTPPCPRPASCKPGFWKDMCKSYTGAPWCVPADVLKMYRRPIEIKCSATGDEMRKKVGSPDGCWWLNKFSRHDIQRLPGNIKGKSWMAGGWFVDASSPAGKEAITEKQAENWIIKGELSDPQSENSEWLRKREPPAGTEAKLA